jgi:hypothetical protein
MKAYLHFGGPATVYPDGPRLTIEAPAKEKPLPWQEKGLQYTASGYGARIPSRYVVRVHGRWRRVYVACYGNAGSAYIGKPGAWLCTVDLEGRA